MLTMKKKMVAVIHRQHYIIQEQRSSINPHEQTVLQQYFAFLQLLASITADWWFTAVITMEVASS
jgi:hypothetical protein